MDEGLEHDDRYRIVEDELLSVAQRWTVHLHAAEYKRQQKMAKSRNAETISSISRPITGRMPDHTRRKVESIDRSKTQRSAVEGLIGSDDSDDGLPYVGTTLHGLMDSPRGKSASLSKVGSFKTGTRAAAGFQKPASQSKLSQRVASDSPLSKNILSRQASKHPDGMSTESSDEDDDLDAPIPALKLEKVDRVRATKPTVLSNSRSITSSSSILGQGRPEIAATLEKFPPRPSSTDIEPPRTLSDGGGRVARRLERARLERASQQEEEQKKNHLDVIPTFL